MPLSKTITEQEIWEILSKIPDPEIPVINIAELGVLRKVEVLNNNVLVTITPTYSGCPAMHVFENDIKKVLTEAGFQSISIQTIYSPAWTTDWITEEAKQKLKAYGIAPPLHSSEDKNDLFKESKRKIACPFCNSKNTKLTSQFGSTACKALHYCNHCEQPFEYFKCL